MGQQFMRVEEVAEILDVSTSYAYKVIRELNEELKRKGFSHPHRNPAKRLRWGEEGQGSGVRDGHKAVPNGADFDPTRCRVPFSAKYTLRVKGRPCWGRQPHTEPQRGVSEANRRLRRLLGRRCCRGQSPRTPSGEPTALSHQRGESVIVGYYTSRRKCLP